MDKNKWIKLKPLLSEINQVLEEINNFNNKHSSLIVKDISLDLPCYIRKNNDSDLQIQIPDPTDTHNNEKILSKFRFNCDMLHLKMPQNDEQNEDTEEEDETNDEFIFGYDANDERIEEQESEDEKGNQVYEKSIEHNRQYNTSSQDDNGEIDIEYDVSKNYKYNTILIK